MLSLADRSCFAAAPRLRACLPDLSVESEGLVAPLCVLSLPAGMEVLAPVVDVSDGAAGGGLSLLLVCASAGRPTVRSAARATPLSRCFITKSF